MAYKYQTAVVPTLYNSNILTQLVNGSIDTVFKSGIFNNLTDVEMFDLINSDPSQITNISLDMSEGNTGMIAWRLLPKNVQNDAEMKKFWGQSPNNYWSILGHNLLSAGEQVNIQPFVAVDDGDTMGATTDFTISNYINGMTNIEYDGWSMDTTTAIPNDTAVWIGLEFNADSWNTNIEIGSIFFGNKYTLPRNCDLSQTTEFEWKTKQKQTIKGKTISTLSYDKPNKWVLNAFDLNKTGSPTTSISERSGIRSYDITFSFLDPKHLIGSNISGSTDGFDETNNTDYHADDNAFRTMSKNLFTEIVSKVKGNHLPLILQLDSNNKNSDNFSMVRMERRYKLKQISPDLYNVSLKFIEQI